MTTTNNQSARNRRWRVAWHLITRPWLNLYLVFNFISAWWWTRRLADIAAGLPSIAVLLTVGGIFAAGWHRSPKDRVEGYHSEATRAFKSENFDRAELYLRRLVHLEPGRASHKFQLALCAEQQDQRPRARQLMQQIVDHGTDGIAARAHLWLAHDLAKNAEPEDAHAGSAFERHLIASLMLDESLDGA